MQAAEKIVPLRRAVSSKSNFIDFILDIATAGGLETGMGIKEVILKGSVEDLKEWFIEKGYNIPVEECSRIIEHKDHLVDFKKNINAYMY